ncbi:hypothetical protein ACH49O_11685 [Streptomyces coeruleorubidus]|uniref:TRADD-N-associated membrane domain-containing protein n=1 Tax=Streptomyces coeruleorubidus TaxID=116188 RepID=UPI0033E83B57
MPLLEWIKGIFSDTSESAIQEVKIGEQERREEKEAADRERKEWLEERKGKLQRMKDRRELAAKFYIAIGAFLVAIAIYLGIEWDDEPLFTAITEIGIAFYGILATLGGIHILTSKATSIQIQAIEDEIDLLDEVNPSVRSLRLFKQHQLELKRYYDQSLSHGATLFFVGIFCIIIGFSIIGATLYILSRNPDTELGVKILIGAVGSIGGILSNFIAAIFLNMFNTTARSLKSQHEKLTSIHLLHFGNFLAEKLNAPELRDNTLSVMARSVANPVEFQGKSETEMDVPAASEKSNP